MVLMFCLEDDNIMFNSHIFFQTQTCSIVFLPLLPPFVFHRLRINARVSIYCAQAGHFLASCPVQPNEGDSPVTAGSW